MRTQFGVFGTALIASAIIPFSPTPVVAQSYFPVPNQLSVGIGVAGDSQPKQRAATFALSLAFVDSGTDYWPYRLGWVLLEAEFGPGSDLQSCRTRDAGPADAPHCDDAALLTGLRFHFFQRRSAHRVLPFANLLAGSYWKGSGEKDRDFVSEHVALQAGGGIDLRRTGSAHGLRLAFDYRHVFAADASRNQFRFVTAYTLGPPTP
jgi:hypothetical protein